MALKGLFVSQARREAYFALQRRDFEAMIRTFEDPETVESDHEEA